MSALELGEQIRKRRKQLQIGQQDLAELAGLSTNTVYKIETGQANPSLDVLSKLLDVLGMELSIQVKIKI